MEFRLLELTFLGLIVAGVIFSIDIFINTTSYITKFGVILLSVAMSLILPATWFTLRRAKYPTSSFDSPEDVATAGIKTILKFTSVGIVAVVTIFAAQFGLSWAHRPGYPLMLISAGILGVAALLGVISTGLKYIGAHLEKHIENEWIIETRGDMEKIRGRIEHCSTNSESDTDYKKIKSVSTRSKDEVMNILREVPNQVDDSISRDIEDVLYQLNVLLDFLTERENLQSEIIRYSRERSKADEMLNSADEQLSNIETEANPEGIAELREKTERAETYINEVDSTIEGLEEQINQLDEKIDSQVEKINETIQQIIEKELNNS